MMRTTRLRGACAPCLAWLCACGVAVDTPTDPAPPTETQTVPDPAPAPAPDPATDPLLQPPRADVLWGTLRGAVADATVTSAAVGTLTLEADAGVHHLRLVAPADQPNREVMLWLHVEGGLDQPALSAGRQAVVRQGVPRSGRLGAWAYGCVRTVGNASWDEDDTAEEVRILSVEPGAQGALLLQVHAAFPSGGTHLWATLQVPAAHVTQTPWFQGALEGAQATLNGRQVPVIKSSAVGDPHWSQITVALLDGAHARVLDLRFPLGMQNVAPDGAWAPLAWQPWVHERGAADGARAPFRLSGSPEGTVLELAAELPDGTRMRLLGRVDDLVVRATR